MWELDHKEGLAPKNQYFQIVMLEKTLESPLDYKENQPVNPKGNQSWIFIGRTDAEAETPILWPPDAKNWLVGKDPDAGKDWRREEKGTAEDQMVGWHHWLTRWTWVWVRSGSWWCTRKAGVLQSMGSQRFGHDWVTELNWTPWRHRNRDQITNIHQVIEKAREFQKNIYFCLIDYAKAFDYVDHKLWKITKEMRIQDHLTCFPRNLNRDQEATVRTGHETTDWLKIGKGV